MSDGGRRERFLCPECGHVVIADVRSHTGDWSLEIECSKCDEKMDAGIHAYALVERGQS